MSNFDPPGTARGKRLIDPRQHAWRIPFNIRGNDSDEDWSRRLRKRRAAVTHIKSQPEYQAQTQSQERAPTPDPENRMLCKRGWEAKVMEWRKILLDKGPT